MGNGIRCSLSLCSLLLWVVGCIACTAGMMTAAEQSQPLLRVGVYDNRPKLFVDETGQVSGFWADIIRHIADAEGWQLEFVHASWTECLERLQRHEIDVMPDVAYSEERSALFAFSQQPVHTSWSGVYAATDSAIESLLDLEGRRLAVLTGSINVDGPGGIRALLDAFSVQCTLIEEDSYAAVFAAVESGAADAALANKDFASQYTVDSQLQPTPIIFQPARLHFACASDAVTSAALLASIDRHLLQMKQDPDSVYYQSLKTWFGIQAEPEALPGWLWNAMWCSGALLLLLLLMNLLLRAQVRARTSELHQDIVRRQEAEEKLRHQQLLLEEMGQMAHVGGWEFDPHSGAGTWTAETARIHDMDPDEPTSLEKGLSFYHGESRQRIEAAVKEAATKGTGYDLELEMTTASGARKWIRSIAHPLVEDGQVRLIRGSFQDITAVKQNAEHIRHLNAVLNGIRHVNQLITREKDPEQLIQKACTMLVEARGFHSVVVALTDDQGIQVEKYAGAGSKVALLEEMFRRGELSACARHSIRDHTITVLSCREDPCHACPAARTGQQDVEDTMIIALEQDERVYGFMLVSVDGGHGHDPNEHGLLSEVAGDIAFALRSMEIEAERNATAAALADTEEQLRQVQKLEAIGQLAGGIAHDFNNILMVQIGYCDMLKDRLDDERTASQLAQIRACADRAAALTRQLLAFSRKQALQPEVLDLNAVITQAGQMLSRLIGEHINLVTVPGQKLGRVKADPGQIEQVIMNLVVNARDAMPNGGTLSIETSNVVLDERYARNHVGARAGPHVLLAISDTGCGMDETTRQHSFEPFFTTKGKDKGTGLGLSTVYGIVKQSKGNIWVYSEVGQGTTFKVYLPRVDEEPSARQVELQEPQRGQGQSILVVEDEAALRELLVEMIDDLGYQVTAAADGNEALELIKGQGLRPDLMITDMIMPGINGRDLAERARQIQPGLKVLYASGYTDNAIVHQGVLDPDTPFLQKPFTIDDLAVKIPQLLDA